MLMSRENWWSLGISWFGVGYCTGMAIWTFWLK